MLLVLNESGQVIECQLHDFIIGIANTQVDAEAEYKELLRQLEEDDNVTQEQIEDFKRVAIIQRSIEEVRKRAKDLQDIRRSPTRYNNVQSKVMQHVYGSKTNLTSSNLRSMNLKQSQDLYTEMTASLYKSGYATRCPDKREKPFDITQGELDQIRNIKLN